MNGLNKHIRLRLLDKEHVYKKLKTVQNYSKEIKSQLLFISTIHGNGLFQNKAINEA